MGSGTVCALFCGSGTVCALFCGSCCFIFVPFILQTVGFFTPMWGSNSTCDSIGLVYSCCAGGDNDTCKNTNGGDELDVRALGLHATSSMVMFLTVFFLCCGICCNGDDDDDLGWCAIMGGCCSMLFPVAGLFSIIGCIIVATKFSTSELGYSFYLCLTAGCYVILLTIILCCIVYKANKDDDDAIPRPRSVTPSNTRGRGSSVTPYAGGESGRLPSVAPYAGGGSGRLPSVTPYAGGGSGRLPSVAPYAGDGSGRLPSVAPYAGGESGRLSSVAPYAGGGSVAPYQPRQQEIFYAGGESGRLPSVTPYAGGGRLPSVAPYAGDGSGSVAPYQPRQQEIHVEAQQASAEEAMAVHDQESGRIFLFFRKINITRVFASMKQN